MNEINVRVRLLHFRLLDVFFYASSLLFSSHFIQGSEKVRWQLVDLLYQIDVVRLLNGLQLTEAYEFHVYNLSHIEIVVDKNVFCS